jgi:hypothetical protein
MTVFELHVAEQPLDRPRIGPLPGDRMSSAIFNWLFRRKKSRLPGYSGLRSIPLSEIAPDLEEEERSQAYTSQRNEIESALLAPPRRPSEDSPLFTTLVATDKPSVITINLPDRDEKCVPIFSTSVRAADYVDVCLSKGPNVRYLVSSSVGLLGLLGDLRTAGIQIMALDRCPRCSMFTSINTTSLKNADDLIKWWSIVKATEFARLDLYMSYALRKAQSGLFEIARQVAFETVVHVSPEDPRPHLLLGQLAAIAGDRSTFGEVKAFLRFLKLDAWERKLDEDARSGSRTFEGPEFFSKLKL